MKKLNNYELSKIRTRSVREVNEKEKKLDELKKESNSTETKKNQQK